MTLLVAVSAKRVAGTTTCYIYTDEGLVGEYGASGNYQNSYGWKPNGLWGTDPVYQRTPTGLYYYHNDHLGTPQRLSDNTDAIAWNAGYAAFGNATVDPFLTTVENNLRFAGQYFDQESGLHYNLNRFYDPKVGRYTQVDPIGFFTGDVNFYRYVNNNSLNWIDPYGLWGIPILTPFDKDARWLHFQRNRFNQDYENEGDARKNWGAPLQKWQSTTHQIGNRNENNVKYVSPDGHSEAVYNNGQLVTDPINQGTYNVFGPDSELGHGLFDVIPWVMWGNSPDDPTSPLGQFNTLIDGWKAKKEANPCAN